MVWILYLLLVTAAVSLIAELAGRNIVHPLENGNISHGLCACDNPVKFSLQCLSFDISHFQLLSSSVAVKKGVV